MQSQYDRLCQEFFKLSQISHAITFLQWDQLVMMPPGGQESRSKSIAELTTLQHQMLSSPALGELIDKALNKEQNDLTLRSIKEMQLTHRRAACLPADLVKAQSLAGSHCEYHWREQRKNNDWPGFLANFNEVVMLARSEASARQEAGAEHPTPYDAMLDLYCTGDTSDHISSVFNRLTEELPSILKEVIDQQPQGIDLTGTYPIDKQKQLNYRLMELLGFNFEAGRLDVSLHPFSTGGRGDQRITTRFTQTDFLEALQATAHETGHASYENGLPEQWDGLPIGKARNMCIHESQSLLFEKHIFLSREFFTYLTNALHDYLPGTQCYQANQIWAECLRVQPSFIRVEADEVTYPLHVALRFEIERDLINGTIEARDIPEIWDQKMQNYLGLSTQGDFANGCLQDIHWTDGTFGYFPSYTMGAVNAAQLFKTFCHEFPDWRDNLAAGDVTVLKSWLAENIWSKGSSLASQEIMQKATGEKTNPDHFLAHLNLRYLNR